MRRWGAVAALALVACTAPDGGPVGGDSAAEPEATGSIDVIFALNRLSLDLRGRRPDIEEQEAVLAEPELLEAALEEMLYEETFGTRVKAWYADVLRTRTEYYPALVAGYGPGSPADLWASVGEEPLELMARVATEDLPWTEIATADWSMADELLASRWPVEYPEGAEGWQVVRYTDGRPAAGILSTNAFHWRYTSTLSNQNRGRANAATRILLCSDLKERSVPFDATVDLADEAAVTEALDSDPSCVSCHVSLDPLAAHFWGFFSENTYSALESSYYRLGREEWWSLQDRPVGPGYFGASSSGLESLGRHIAADPRFASCVVEQIGEALMGRAGTLEELDQDTAHREAFIAGGATLRSLVRSLAMDPRYLDPRELEGEHAGARAWKIVRPDVLASQVETLTSFTWVVDDGSPALATDVEGVRVLAGGADGYVVSEAPADPPATTSLVQRRLAEGAADHAVALALEGAAPPILEGLDLTADDPEAARAWLERAGRLALGRPLDAAELDELHALHQDLLVHADGDVAEAAAGTLTALLRDPALLLY